MYNISIILAFVLVCSVGAHAAEYDPTRPLSGGVSTNGGNVAPTDIVLQSIIKDNKAIISGKLVQKGERYMNYEIIAINDKSVVIQSPERERTLTLFSQAIVNYKNK